MPGDTTKLTIRLPRKHVEFAKAYAKVHHLTATEVFDRYLRRLQARDRQGLSAEIEALVGLVPPDVDAEDAYRRHLMEKHGR